MKECTIHLKLPTTNLLLIQIYKTKAFILFLQLHFWLQEFWLLLLNSDPPARKAFLLTFTDYFLPFLRTAHLQIFGTKAQVQAPVPESPKKKEGKDWGMTQNHNTMFKIEIETIYF